MSEWHQDFGTLSGANHWPSPSVWLLTRCGVVGGRGAAGLQDRGDAGWGQAGRHVQQGLDDVTLEDGILLPQVEDSYDLALRHRRPPREHWLA